MLVNFLKKRPSKVDLNYWVHELNVAIIWLELQRIIPLQK